MNPRQVHLKAHAERLGKDTGRLVCVSLFRQIVEWLFMPQGKLPQLGVFLVGAVGAGDGDDEAVRTVEKAGAQKIAAQKAQRRAQQQVAPAEPAALRKFLLGGDGGKTVERLKVITQVVVGVVPDRVAQALDGAGNDHFVVRFLALGAAAVFAEEAQLDIRIPFAMPDPATEIIDLAGALEADRGAAAALEFGENFLAQGGRNLLVGIEK